MKHFPCSRLFLFMIAFAWGIALDAQPQVEAPLATFDTACAPLVSLRLAGLPRPGATPGQRIFFTVQEDVFRNDSLLIAAGARAKGWIRAIRQTDTTLSLAVELEAVQTVGGEMMGFVQALVSMEMDLRDKEESRFQSNPLVNAGPKAAVKGVEVENLFRTP
ncbi:MAG: hypothetical protein EPGJADBJ_03388 [Saprospiraceae bacterium]|nr:hypothetical protein [Saprospiraceae bacterium]